MATTNAVPNTRSAATIATRVFSGAHAACSLTSKSESSSAAAE